MNLYAKSIIGAGFIISSLEISALIVHIKLKSESIDHCKNRLSDEDDQTRVDDCEFFVIILSNLLSQSSL